MRELLEGPNSGCGDRFFLRAPSGAHLGFDLGVNALRDSQRFAPARLLRVKKTSNGESTRGDHLCLGDSVHLYSDAQTKNHQPKRLSEQIVEPLEGL